MAISQSITVLPTPPSRADPDNFDARADSFLGALPTMQTQMNTWAGQANSTATTVNDDKVAAQSAKSSAESARDTASGHASTASGHASTATTQAGTATTQAGIATTQAGIATTQAGIATTQAGLATTARQGAEAARDDAVSIVYGTSWPVGVSMTEVGYLDGVTSAIQSQLNGKAASAAGVTNGDSHDHSGGDGAQIAYANLSGLPTLGTAAAAATTDFAAATKFIAGAGALTGPAAPLTIGTAAAAATGDFAAASHAHGSITSAGAIGSTANLPIITTTSGALTVGAFGTGATNFCAGNDARLSDARTPTAHNQAETTITFTDVATGNASTTAHGYAPKATAPASGLVSVLAIGNGETVRSDKALFDTTNPAALGSVGPGTAVVAARRDHVHAMPSAANVGAASASSFIAGAGALTGPAAPLTIGTAAGKNIPATGNASATEVVYGNDTRLTDARTPSSHTTGSHSDWPAGVSMTELGYLDGVTSAVQTQINTRVPMLTAALDLYVATTGNDSNSGTSSGSPFLTIQKAIDVAVGYHLSIHNITIRIAAGTYDTDTAIILKSYATGGGICANWILV